MTDADAVPPERSTTIQRGDLFALGRHRLLCGDSTNATDVARVLAGTTPLLLVTDPPYGVDYDPAWRARAGVNLNTQKLGTVANDDRADWTDAWRLFPGDVAYVWHAGLKASVWPSHPAHTSASTTSPRRSAKPGLGRGSGDRHYAEAVLSHSAF